MNNTIKKHFHLTLHFTVTGNESKIPTEGVNAKVHYTRSGDDAAWRKSDDRMRRLYKAVVSDKRVLRAFFESCISVWLETETAQHWNEILFDEDMLDEHRELRLEDILRPAITRLPEEDEQWFAKIEANKVFYDHLDEFIDCFSTELDYLELSEIEMEEDAQ